MCVERRVGIGGIAPEGVDDRLLKGVVVIQVLGPQGRRRDHEPQAGEQELLARRQVVSVCATATVDEIERTGGTALAVGAELGVDNDVDTLFTGVEAGLAGRPLDILVNNAAAAPAGPLGATTRKEFDHLFAVNVRAPYFIIQRALPLLRDGGRIVTISSVATRMANPAQTSFAMTKGAVETMTMTLANELGVRGITVNAVAPGATRTATNGSFFEAPGLVELIAATTALDRLGGPDDVADVVAFLASDAARWITGQVIDASGGLFLGPRAG